MERRKAPRRGKRVRIRKNARVRLPAASRHREALIALHLGGKRLCGGKREAEVPILRVVTRGEAIQK